MTTIKPFKALRPIPDRASEVASVPYDVVDSNEARLMARGNPFSFLHVIRPEIDLPVSIDLYDERVYRKGAANLKSLIERGVLVDEDKPCIYLYRLVEDGREQTGITACCAVDDYDNDVIKKHEHTRQDKEDDRVRNMLALSAHSGPVLMAYRSSESIKAMMEAYTRSSSPAVTLYDFTADDGVQHRIWRIDGGGEFIDAFKTVPALYIADGHHRAAGASRVRREIARQRGALSGEEECNFFLAVLFPSDQLKNSPYNRYVSELGGLDPQNFLGALEKRFGIVEGGPEPLRKGMFGMYLGSTWYLIEPKEEELAKIDARPEDPVFSLDLSVFERLLLEPVLGITDQRSDNRIEFVGGRDSVGRIERMVAERGGAGFTFFPVSISELLAVADAGKVMPPKSTWFTPKLRSGLLIHRF
jgi:uncharacterized protein (DUF1015 family)